MARPGTGFTHDTARIMATQMRVMEMAIKGGSLHSTLYEVVVGIHEIVGREFHPAILLVSDDGLRLEFGAAAGMGNDYIEAVQGFPIGPSYPSCSSVAFSNQPSFVSDVEHDPLWRPYLSVARASNIRSCWSFPIRSASDKPLGTLALYRNVPGLPESEVVEIMRLFAETAALIIERAKAQEAREKAEADREVAIRALTQRQQEFEELADAIPQLVWISDTEGRRFWFNRGWREYTGTSVEDASGFGWEAVHHEQHLPRMREKLDRSIRTGEMFEDTFPLRSKDGHFRWFVTRAVPVRDSEGQIVRWIGTNTDVTTLKDTEEALRRAEANAATGRMAHAMAHEINNPLEAINCVIYLLANFESLPARAQELVKVAQEEIDRISHIARRTFGLYTSSTRSTKVEICALLEKILNTFSNRIAEKSLLIERQYRWTGAAEVMEDSLAEGLWNVIDNAVEATRPQGKIVLRVSKTRSLRPHLDHHLRITIADDGPGIPAEQRKMMFQPFSSTKIRKGAGLGLWVLRNVVIRHSGEVQIKTSREGPRTGTTCSILLPLARRSGAAA